MTSLSCYCKLKLPSFLVSQRPATAGTQAIIATFSIFYNEGTIKLVRSSQARILIQVKQNRRSRRISRGLMPSWRKLGTGGSKLLIKRRNYSWYSFHGICELSMLVRPHKALWSLSGSGCHYRLCDECNKHPHNARLLKTDASFIHNSAWISSCHWSYSTNTQFCAKSSRRDCTAISSETCKSF